MLRFNVEVMGVVIGTADGWDEMDILCLQFYNFESAVKAIPSADSISIAFDKGKLDTYGEEGFMGTYDLLPILKSL